MFISSNHLQVLELVCTNDLWTHWQNLCKKSKTNLILQHTIIETFVVTIAAFIIFVTLLSWHVRVVVFVTPSFHGTNTGLQILNTCSKMTKKNKLILGYFIKFFICFALIKPRHWKISQYIDGNFDNFNLHY